ncbi:MAG: succinate dehydrogenase, cytochrome b556 subunit [Alphaproteobacteria bacterium]|nr:succinate dehydrogenase, cytochrome b556 subunit [Alphaproteobacteria bacterium]
MTRSTPTPPRPLSPHLLRYKPQMTSMLSILHRITGSALAVGLVFMTWVLWAIASGPEAYAHVQAFCTSLLGFLMLFGWSFALYYHLCNGIRHLIWDTGALFEINEAKKAGYAVLVCAAALTSLTWFAAAYL